jgi:hypothetical protein
VRASTATIGITARYLLDRLTQPRIRADEIRSLRLKFSTPRGQPSAEEVRIAGTLLELRQTLSACFRNVRVCGGCVQPPTPGWPGGHCCSGRTEQLFTDLEISALRLSGTRYWHLRLPRSDQQGCVFRGPKGCSLHPRHRPTLCVRYTCLELEAELGQTAQRCKIRALQKELRILSEQFARVRVARRDRERALQMEREVLAMCRPGVRQTPTGDPEPCGK